MQKLTIILVVAVLAVAVSVPIFADDIENVIANITSGNNSTLNNTTVANATNGTLAPEQLQALNDTQTKLTALIAQIESLKANYSSSGNTGLLNALDQFEKQANKLNSQIQSLTSENSTLEAGAIAGLLNSIQKREAALEHKVSIKEKVLLKQSTKKAKNTKSNKHKNHVNKDENQNEDQNDNQDENQNEDQDHNED